MGLLRFRPLVAALGLGILPAAPSGAIDIILHYDDLGENPSWDPNGTQLMAVAHAAEHIWENLIPTADPNAHDIDVSWSQLDTGQLGLWKLDPFGNNNIYFDSSGTNWFIDPTPSSNSEFDFGDPLTFSSGKGSYLVGTTDLALAYFDGATPPDALEIGYQGKGVSGSPKSDYDLLSAILHEMGHDLGVGGDILSGRYPIYPDDVLGIQGLEVIEGDCEGSGHCEEHGHLAPPSALMSWASPAGVRVLPSAVDVLAAARDSNWTDVDLARKFSGKDGSWGDALTWIGGRVPDSSDQVTLVHGGTTTLTGSRTADSVAIDLQTTLDATGDLAVDHELRIGRNGHLRSAFGSDISAETLTMDVESDATLTGGHLVVGGGDIKLNALASGRGILETNGTLQIEGSIGADGGDLRLDGTGALKLNALSGYTNTGVLNAHDGDLGLAVGFTSDSVGRIQVSGGHSLTALEDLTIPSGVTVQLHDADLGTATIDSAGAATDLTIRSLLVGSIGTGTSGDGEIVARTVRLEDSAIVNGGSLRLASPVLTTLAGGLQLSGFNGTVTQAGDISVQGGTVDVSVHDFDWGNSTSAVTHSLTIDPNATLHVTSDSLGSASGAFRGEMQIDSGVLNVETATGWTLPAESTRGGPAGTLGMIHSGAADPVVQGSPLTVGGNLVVAGGDAFIQAPLISTPSATIFVWGNSRLILDGPTTMGGGSWSGDTLVQSDDITVTHDTTIATDTFDWGNSFGLNRHSLSVENGATLTVASNDTGDPDNQFRGGVVLNGGRLAVNTDQPWTLPASSLFLAGGGITMDGSHSATHVSGQSLSVGGSIDVTAGEANIDTDLTLLSTATTHIAAGATLDVNGATGYGGTFTGDGTLHHNGSAFYVSSTPLAIPNLVQDGLFTFASISGHEAELDTHTLRFADGSQTRLFSDLRIKGAATVEQGASFTSGGTLIIDAAGSLSGASVSTPVRNEGTLSPGFSPGLMEIGGDFAQLGTLSIELGGTQRGITHDAIAVDGDIALDGVLDLILYGGFTPVAGDSFDILDWTGTLSGAFDSFVFPGGPDAWDASDLYTTGVLRFVPEPGTALLLALGLTALRAKRTRR